MYDPVIDITSQFPKYDLDDEIMKIVWSYNVNVKKEELLKALEYDRNQYDKGYKDGYDACRREVEELLDMADTIRHAWENLKGD